MADVWILQRIVGISQQDINWREYDFDWWNSEEQASYLTIKGLSRPFVVPLFRAKLVTISTNFFIRLMLWFSYVAVVQSVLNVELICTLEPGLRLE